eukprot:gene61099-83563_t
MPRFKDFRPAGVIPATLLALHDDMSIDERQTRRHLRDCALVDGVSAVTVNGHASEALAPALNAERQAQGLSWTDLGRRLRVAPSTLQGVGARSRLEADGVIGMVRKQPAATPGGNAIGQRRSVFGGLEDGHHRQVVDHRGEAAGHQQQRGDQQ